MTRSSATRTFPVRIFWTLARSFRRLSSAPCRRQKRRENNCSWTKHTRNAELPARATFLPSRFRHRRFAYVLRERDFLFGFLIHSCEARTEITQETIYSSILKTPDLRSDIVYKHIGPDISGKYFEYDKRSQISKTLLLTSEI